MHDNQDNSTAQSATELIKCGRAIHAVLDQIDDEMEKHLNINRTDLRCLNALEHGPLTPTQLATRLGLTSGSITALVDRLEQRGFVARTRSATDRRSMVIELQPIVFHQIGTRYRLVADSITARFQGLSEQDHAEAITHLQALIEALELGLTQVREARNPPPATD